jgi:hypothetical protein
VVVSGISCSIGVVAVGEFGVAGPGCPVQAVRKPAGINIDVIITAITMFSCICGYFRRTILRNN